MRAKLPFQHLDKTGWRNLAYAGIGIFYLIHFSLGIIQYGSLKIFGIDYLAFHGAARIANTVGYPASYDPSWLSKVEGSLAAHEPSDAGFSPNPAPFLPVFLIPFQILEPLGISLAYWAWTLVNLIALIFYTYFFVSKFTDQKAALKLILFVLLFLPTYQTLI